MFLEWPNRVTLSSVFVRLLLLGSGACVIMSGGKVPEWPIGAVSKTAAGLCSAVGSNPTLPACPYKGGVPGTGSVALGGVSLWRGCIVPGRVTSGEVA
jgi:hypothetical protein